MDFDQGERTQRLASAAVDIGGHIQGCDHAGLHAPRGRYLREREEFGYVTVCGGCGAETAEVAREKDKPAYDATGNERFLAAR